MIIVSITTYNRPEMLLSLIKQLTEQPTKHSLVIYVYNDHSTVGYNLHDYVLNKKWTIFYQELEEHHGKEKYWKLVDKIFKSLKHWDKMEYYIHLQDDIVLCDNFIDRAVECFEKIIDPSKISLYLHDGGKRLTEPCWTSFDPVTVVWENEEFHLTQWIDMCAFIVKKNFLSVLEYKLEPIVVTNKEPSSGVGKQISKRLYKNYHLYRKPLVTHGDHKSVMHE